MKGRGVLRSWKMGILIATLEPRRRRMFAARVLRTRFSCANPQKPGSAKQQSDVQNSRKTNVRVDDLVGKEEAPTRITYRFVMRIEEYSRCAQAWKGSESHGDLMVVHLAPS
jgi:hypothetical protein